MPSKKDEQLTVWDNEQARMINSSHGDIAYGDWCKCDVARMKRVGGTVGVRVRRRGPVKECALFAGVEYA